MRRGTRGNRRNRNEIAVITVIGCVPKRVNRCKISPRLNCHLLIAPDPNGRGIETLALSPTPRLTTSESEKDFPDATGIETRLCLCVQGGEAVACYRSEGTPRCEGD